MLEARQSEVCPSDVCGSYCLQLFRARQALFLPLKSSQCGGEAWHVAFLRMQTAPERHTTMSQTRAQRLDSCRDCLFNPDFSCLGTQVLRFEGPGSARPGRFMGVLASTAQHPFDVVHYQDKVIVSTHVGQQVGCHPSSEASALCMLVTAKMGIPCGRLLCKHCCVVTRAVHHALAWKPL